MTPAGDVRECRRCISWRRSGHRDGVCWLTGVERLRKQDDTCGEFVPRAFVVDRTAPAAPPPWAPIAGVRVVGVTGRARHGKDTLARELMRQLAAAGTLAERFAFSDSVAVAERTAPLPGDAPMTTRNPSRLQRRGEYERARDPFIWLRATYGTIEDRRPEVAIITGLRTPAEVAMVRGMGGLVVRVTRIDAEGQPFVTSDRDPNHPIEQQIDSLQEDLRIDVKGGGLAEFPTWAYSVLQRLELVPPRTPSKFPGCAGDPPLY